VKKKKRKEEENQIQAWQQDLFKRNKAHGVVPAATIGLQQNINPS